jgi:HSP20 family molecular chaperone IbpA
MITKTETGKAMTAQPKAELTGVEATRPGPLFTPAVDIYESDTAITVLADMPGVRGDGLTIDLRDNTLTIEGAPTDVVAQGERLLLREYDTGTFYRQFRLSNAIDQGKIDASLNDGVLRLTLPKAEAARPRKIEVRSD